ncbi:MAG TPA: hypothetical protein ENJ52_00430 [Aliiroseovarius sp.]|nr:hypothetical protein [Aliiroseovarius sp.]
MKGIGKAAVLAAVSGLLAAPATAEERFRPTEPCSQALGQASAEMRVLVAGWVLGFMEAGLKQGASLGAAERDKALETMDSLCAAYPDRSLIDITAAVVTLAQRDQQAEAEAAADPAPGSEADARALVAAFLAPDADAVALTRALRPTEADIRAVYTDPLATSMAAVYAQVWADPKNLTVAPKPGQSEMLLWWTTTDKLIAGDPVLGKFPGGYKDVLAFMRPGFPIVRFKFVKPGETTGYAFDGLVFVNDRWVLMPKPWRMLQ